MEIKRGPENPYVNVEEITIQEGKVLIGGMQHDLQGGANLPHAIAIEAHAWLQTPGRSAYYLTWEGSKIPRGAVVGGKKVQSASNKIIVADAWGDDIIGKYSRVQRAEVENSQKQEMVVLAPAPGEEIERH